MEYLDPFAPPSNEARDEIINRLSQITFPKHSNLEELNKYILFLKNKRKEIKEIIKQNLPGDHKNHIMALIRRFKSLIISLEEKNHEYNNDIIKLQKDNIYKLLYYYYSKFDELMKYIDVNSINDEDKDLHMKLLELWFIFESYNRYFEYEDRDYISLYNDNGEVAINIRL